MTTTAGARDSTRAQSEVVGVALLVGVFALLAILVGVVLIGNVSEQADGGPLVELNTSATTTDLVVVHEGGDALSADDVTVIVRQDGDDRRYGLNSFSEARGSDPSRLSGGERWNRSHSLSSGTARLLVVHGPSNEVVHDELIEVP